MNVIEIYNILKNIPSVGDEDIRELADIIADKGEAAATKLDIRDMELKLMTHIAELEVRLIKWIIGINIATATFIIAIIKLL